MSSKSIVKATDDLGVSIPAPKEPFTATVIHPRNLAIQARQESARKLSKSEYREAVRDLKALRQVLSDSGYYDLLSKYRLLKQRHKLYQEELERATTDEDRDEYRRLIEQVRAEGYTLWQSLQQFGDKAKRYETRLIELKTHDQEVEREQAHIKLNKLMMEEAKQWKDILIRKWTQLGMAYEHYDKNGKRIVDQVQFEQIVITPDVVWFKIAVTVKTLFGVRSVLPHRVPVRDLIAEQTLVEQSYACQRQVTAEASYASGVWLLLHRLGTTNGLIEYVTLDQVLQYYPYEDRDLMPIPLGVGERREIKWLMLAEHPHFLVGGSTGNGKSNFTHAIICSLIRFQSPEDLQLVFIDLKEGVEFNVYEGIPHQLMPVVRRVEDAVNTLAQMEALRAERMEMISKAGCTDILEYNEKHPDKKIPRIVIFVDEYARLKARGKEFEAIADQAVGEITALGRAAGVHLFAATQTPYARILPGEAKNNMTVRVAFAMRTLAASQSILDSGEARKLPMEVKGRSLAAVGSVAFETQTPHTPHEYRKESAQLAKGHDAPPDMITLPEVVKIDVFDENELLDIAINELGGNLGARPIFEFAKDQDGVTLNRVREMVKQIRNRKTVEFEGVTYKLVPDRTGTRLVAQNRKSVEATHGSSGEKAARLPTHLHLREKEVDDQKRVHLQMHDELHHDLTSDASGDSAEETTALAIPQVET